MSKYITKKRMKEAGIAGHVNIPYGTEVEEVDGLIIYKGAAVCAITSRNAHLHFAKNDDGKGLERGALTLAITFRLEKRDAGYQGRWDLGWEDPVCQKYRRPEHEDFFLWGHAFYEAPVEEQNFSTLLEMINAMEVREDDEEFKNAVDLMFDELKERDPGHFAVRQYAKYKLAAGVVCSKRLLNQAVGKSLRTHNLKPKKGAQVMRKNEKITALYERLSRDDFGKDDDQQRESNSISNQELLCRGWFLPPNTYDCGSFVVNGTAVVGKE